MPTNRDQVTSRRIVRLSLLVILWLGGWPATILGQKARPLVAIREVQADSLLKAFGVDTSVLRRAIVEAVRGVGRLAHGPSDTVPALDVDVRAMRLAGGRTDPVAVLHVEVGRNLVESGRAKRPLWNDGVTLGSYPTWRELSANVLREAVAAVNKYLLASVRGGAP